ncbi:MAG: DUF3307 domain-containing protein [Longimicrobiales bacterium]|nr:DUF3307 domain-containing protein [Longimicrobiales bacterium]
MTDLATALLAALFTCHFLGDFTPLATENMQKAKAVGRPVGAIAAHALVHAVLVGIAVMVVAGTGVALVAVVAGIEFFTHLGIDWARGLLGARYAVLSDRSTQQFWSVLGIDQLAHGIILIWIASLVL